MFAVTILGNNSALPAYGRHPTAQLVQVQDQQLLIDCGEGTQMQFLKYDIKKSKINYIFISHLHGDHYLGLAGLLNTMSLSGRNTELHLFAPAALEEILKLQFAVANTVLGYLLHFHPLPAGSGVLVDEKCFGVSCFPTDHRISCHGFVILQKNPPRKINAAAAQQFGIPFAEYNNLKQGLDYVTAEGRTIANELVTKEGNPNKTYAYCADTRYDEDFLENIRHADLIYHEATYMDEMREKAFERFHSTAKQAAAIAAKAGAKMLLIGHFSSQYQDVEPFAAEAQTVFPHSDITREGATYLV